MAAATNTAAMVDAWEIVGKGRQVRKRAKFDMLCSFGRRGDRRSRREPDEPRAPRPPAARRITTYVVSRPRRS